MLVQQHSIPMAPQLMNADLAHFSMWHAALWSLVTDDKFWCELSEAKWGAAVRELKALVDLQQLSRVEPGGGEQTPVAALANRHAAAQPGACSWFCYASKRMCLKSHR